MTGSGEILDVNGDDGWTELLSWLPDGIDEKMRSTGAFTRSRKIKSPTSRCQVLVVGRRGKESPICRLSAYGNACKIW